MVTQPYRKTPVGAGYGMKEWLAQRVTASFMVLYTVFMLGFVLWCSPQNYAEWKTMMSGFVIRPLTLLFVLALVYHAWIGVRDIFMDYIKSTGLKLVLQSIVVTLLMFYTIWTISILWG